MAARVLPSETAMNKVSTLITSRFAAAYEGTEMVRKQIIAKYPVPEGWASENPPEGITAQRDQEWDDYLTLATSIRKIPDRLRITKADLPKVLQRKDGEDNVAGLAQIKVLLGSLYVREGDELDDTQGEEPDELPAKDDFAPVTE